MAEQALRVRHVYEHDDQKFEAAINEALGRIVGAGGVVADVKYQSDPPAGNRLGGFGALIIYETRPGEEP